MPEPMLDTDTNHCMNKPDLLRRFNRGFWKAFSLSTFPIEFPKTPAEKAELVESVYDDIASARYTPDIPEAELVMNKGRGVARRINNRRTASADFHGNGFPGKKDKFDTAAAPPGCRWWRSASGQQCCIWSDHRSKCTND